MTNKIFLPVFAIVTVLCVACASFLGVALSVSSSSPAEASLRDFYNGSFDYIYNGDYFQKRYNLDGWGYGYRVITSYFDTDHLDFYDPDLEDDPDTPVEVENLLWRIFVEPTFEQSMYCIISESSTDYAGVFIRNLGTTSYDVPVRIVVRCARNNYLSGSTCYTTFDFEGYNPFTFTDIYDVYGNNSFQRSNVVLGETGLCSSVSSIRNSDFTGKPDYVSFNGYITIPANQSRELTICGIQEYSHNGLFRLPTGYCATRAMMYDYEQFFMRQYDSQSYDLGYTDGYSNGYSAGVSFGSSGTWDTLITSIFDAPITILLGRFDGDISSPTYGQRVGGLLNLTIPLGGTTLDISGVFTGILSFMLLIVVVRMIIMWFVK